MVSPAWVRVFPDVCVICPACLSKLSFAVRGISVSTSDPGEVVVPPSGVVPVAVAEFSTSPRSTSSWVSV